MTQQCSVIKCGGDATSYRQPHGAETKYPICRLCTIKALHARSERGYSVCAITEIQQEAGL